jgi:hypothetical protein
MEDNDLSMKKKSPRGRRKSFSFAQKEKRKSYLSPPTPEVNFPLFLEEKKKLEIDFPQKSQRGTGGSSGVVPWVVEHCVAYISSYGMDTEGIFRHSPPHSEMKVLDSLLSQGIPVNFEEANASVHTVAGILKKVPQKHLCSFLVSNFFFFVFLCSF